MLPHLKIFFNKKTGIPHKKVALLHDIQMFESRHNKYCLQYFKQQNTCCA